MAFDHGKDTKVLVAEFDLTAFFRNSTVVLEAATHDISMYGDGSVARQSGLDDGRADLEGLLDVANEADNTAAMLGSANGEVFTLAHGGGALGDSAKIGLTRRSVVRYSSPVGDMVVSTVSLQAEKGLLHGKVLHALGAESATGAFASVDHGAQTTDGGLAVIHVTAFSGTDCDIKIQDSANDSTWADLATFSSVTSVASERVVVSGDVDRYLRANITGGTFTSITFLAAFARRFR